MKRILNVALSLMMLGGAVQLAAQNNAGTTKQAPQSTSQTAVAPADAAKAKTDSMKQLLSLTDEQYAKVLNLNKGLQKGSTSASNVEEQKAFADYDAQLKKILTSDQYKKWQDNEKIVRKAAKKKK